MEEKTFNILEKQIKIYVDAGQTPKLDVLYKTYGIEPIEIFTNCISIFNNLNFTIDIFFIIYLRNQKM